MSKGQEGRRITPSPFRFMPKLGLRVALLLSALLLSACASGPNKPGGYLPHRTAPLELTNTPFIAQELYQCGPASLAMLLLDSEVEVSAQTLVPRVYIPKLRGSLQAEMIAATRDYGRLPYRTAPNLDALLAELRLGRPVLTLQNLGWDFYPVWHYAVVIGYIPDSQQMILRSGTTRRKLKSVEDFVEDWQLADNWGLLALLPGTLPADTSAERYLQAVAGLEAAGKTEAAALAYNSATLRWPDAPAAWLGLGNAKYAQGELSGAEQDYRQALKVTNNDPVVRNNLAQVLAEQGCKDAAQEQIKQALASAPQTLRPALLSTAQEIDDLSTAATCPSQ